MWAVRLPCDYSQALPGRLALMNDMHEAGDASDRTDLGIDFQAALAMAGGDMALLRDLAGAFLEEVPRLLDAIRSAVRQRNSQSLQAAAHQLQGVMRCLHIERALQQSQELEFVSQGEVDWSAIKKMVTELNSTIDLAIEALNRFLSEGA